MRRKNDTPIVIMNASKQPIISIGAKFGKVWINGKQYVYFPDFDAFVRKDCEKIVRKRLNLGAKIETMGERSRG